jgi:hypothetical protein
VKALSGAISDTVFCPSRMQFAGVVAQLQAGVGKHAGSNPPPNLKDALMHAFLHAATTPGAKDTGLDPTIPDSAFAIRQTIEVRKFSVCFNAHRHPGPRNLKFYRRSRACELARCCEEMAISLEVEVVLLDIGRSVLFSHALSVLSSQRRMGPRDLCL